MITTRVASRFGLSMPILLAPTDTFSDARGHRGHPGRRPLVTHRRLCGHQPGNAYQSRAARKCLRTKSIRLSDLSHQTLRKPSYT